VASTLHHSENPISLLPCRLRPPRVCSMFCQMFALVVWAPGTISRDGVAEGAIRTGVTSGASAEGVVCIRVRGVKGLRVPVLWSETAVVSLRK